jgi:hypothetical protein
LKCIPGSQQECPEGFSAGDPEMCFPNTLVDGEWKWVCPEGYHNVDDDETGQFYSGSDRCSGDDFILRREDGNSMTGSSLDYICSEDEHRERDRIAIIVMRIQIVKYADRS